MASGGRQRAKGGGGGLVEERTHVTGFTKKSVHCDSEMMFSQYDKLWSSIISSRDVVLFTIRCRTNGDR